MFTSFLSVTPMEAFRLYSFVLVHFFLAMIVFTLLARWENLICNEQSPWWTNHSVKSDLFYLMLNPIFKICLRFIPVLMIFGPLLIFFPPEQIYMYLANGCGPFGGLAPLSQCIAFLVISDFLFYWNHRMFHNAMLWPLHAVHHGPHDVDWTTAYRFHPLNLALGPWLVTSVVIFLGVAPANILYLAPLEAFMAYFVHANLNITLGPFKYIIATPVFHRWHHTHTSEGGRSNYGAIFSIWDLAFGTFYFPESRLPKRYGIEDIEIEENYLMQLIYPFKKWSKDIGKWFYR